MQGIQFADKLHQNVLGYIFTPSQQDDSDECVNKAAAAAGKDSALVESSHPIHFHS